jgi:hypothetical protein
MHYTLLYNTFILSWWKSVISAMLSGHNSGRSRVAGSTREIRDFYTLVHKWNLRI